MNRFEQFPTSEEQEGREATSEIEPEEIAQNRERYADFSKRAEGFDDRTELRHRGTFEDQRRLELRTKTLEEKADEKQHSPEQQEKINKVLERTKQAMASNEAFLDARLDAMKPEEKDAFLAKQRDLYERAKDTNEALDRFDKSPTEVERDLGSDKRMRERQKYIDAMANAWQALSAHERTAVPPGFGET